MHAQTAVKRTPRRRHHASSSGTKRVELRIWRRFGCRYLSLFLSFLFCLGAATAAAPAPHRTSPHPLLEVREAPLQSLVGVGEVLVELQHVGLCFLGPRHEHVQQGLLLVHEPFVPLIGAIGAIGRYKRGETVQGEPDMETRKYVVITSTSNLRTVHRSARTV